MRKQIFFNIDNIDEFKIKFIYFSSAYRYVSIYDSNKYYSKYSSDFFYNTYDFIAGIGKYKSVNFSKNRHFEKLKKYKSRNKDWLFGYFTYDLKNDIEKLQSKNTDNLKFDEIFFYQPKLVFILKDNTLEISYIPTYSKKQITNIFNKILNTRINKKANNQKIKINSRLTKNQYLNNIKKIKTHIKNGDIYELNYCMEFYSSETSINPYNIYNDLIQKSPTPFSAFVKINSNFLLSASPERFIKKINNKIISQPIKGTIKKTANSEKNKNLVKKLKSDKKEQAENVMIVDLVRNDLSITAKNNSVKVEELFGIYEFPQVYQMISTVVSEKSDNYTSVDVIKNAFPMGSMTGAPKLRAMQLIEKYETSKRGLFSGSVGYFTPNDDFDFNVVIRSILYNSQNKYLSFTVGGAITDKSIPDSEYDECLLKAKAISEVLNIKL